MPTTRNTYPQILRFKEKHGSQYFIINSPDERLQAFYKIFKERLDLGWYYPSLESVQKEYQGSYERLKKNLPEAAQAFTREELEERGLEDTLKALDDYEKKISRLKAEEASETSFIEALHHIGTLPIAEAITHTYTDPRGRSRVVLTNVIDSRSDYQYEGYETIIPNSFTPN